MPGLLSPAHFRGAHILAYQVIASLHLENFMAWWTSRMPTCQFPWSWHINSTCVCVHPTLPVCCSSLLAYLLHILFTEVLASVLALLVRHPQSGIFEQTTFWGNSCLRQISQRLWAVVLFWLHPKPSRVCPGNILFFSVSGPYLDKFLSKVFLCLNTFQTLLTFLDSAIQEPADPPHSLSG